MSDKKQKPEKEEKTNPVNIPFDEAVQRLLRAPTTTNEDLKKKNKEK